MDLKKKEIETDYEKAEFDYINGMKYKDIALKYDVSENTVKSWKRRYGWQRDCTTSRNCRVRNAGNKKLFNEIKEDLLKQLEHNGTYGKHYEDLINDYMELWNVKNNLIADIKERGVSIEWSNGKQFGVKKNDSIAELNKTNAQMLKILSELALKPIPQVDDYDDI